MAKSYVKLENGERDLHAISLEAEEPTGRGVLLSHGFGANKRPLRNYSTPLAEIGVTCLAVDLGGHGMSGGEADDLTVNDHLSDLLAAYDYLEEHPHVDPSRIGIIGMSYSGYLACLASGERGVKSLLLRAPPLVPDKFRDTPHGEYSSEEVLEREPQVDNEALVRLGQFSGEVVLVRMDPDEVVLPAVSNAYEAMIQNGHVETIAGNGHSLCNGTQSAFQSIATTWAMNL